MKLFKAKSTTNNLDKQAKLYTLSAVIVLGLTAAILFISMMLESQQTKKVITSRQELAALKDTAVNVQSLQSYAQSHRDQIGQLPSLFPDEDDFVNVLQEIETLVKKTDPQGTVKVSSSKPVKVQNQNTVSLLIHLQTNANGAINFLREFERLPYILQITSLDLTNDQNLVDNTDLTMSVKLYVADPFSP